MPVRWLAAAVESNRKTQVLDVTDTVGRACADAGAVDGLVIVYCPHTTAGLIVQEAETGLLHDLEGWLERTVPGKAAYHHDRIDDNGASHLRATLAGASVTVPIRSGRLTLGRWQRILFAEFDGPRRRELQIGITT